MTGEEKGLKLLWFKVCVRSHAHKEETDLKEKKKRWSELKTARRNFRREIVKLYGVQVLMNWGSSYDCWVGGKSVDKYLNLRFSLDEPL